MAHDASTFATSAKQRKTPAETAAAEAAHVAAQRAKYEASEEAATDQYQERTT